MTEQQLLERWCEHYMHLHLLLKGERLGELRAERSPMLDKRGLHPYSLIYGQMMELEWWLPELQHLEVDMIAMKRQARQDAERDYREEIIEEHERERARRGEGL